MRKKFVSWFLQGYKPSGQFIKMKRKIAGQDAEWD
jgi:hypothetical protein